MYVCIFTDELYMCGVAPQYDHTRLESVDRSGETSYHRELSRPSRPERDPLSGWKETRRQKVQGGGNVRLTCPPRSDIRSR